MRGAQHSTSAALIPFLREGRELPYVEQGVPVTAARPRTSESRFTAANWARSHAAGALAVAWEPTGPVLGARWVCGGTSKGARLVTRPDWYENCQRCLAALNGDDGPCVYRIFDKSGDRLLYIGSTSNWLRRRGQHRKQTWWWAAAGDVKLERFECLADARTAEEAAIKAERPRMNIAHNRQQAAS